MKKREEGDREIDGVCVRYRKRRAIEQQERRKETRKQIETQREGGRWKRVRDGG